MVGSSPKNSSPSTNTFCTVCPWAVISPLLFTEMPGSFFNKSSAVALAFTLKLSAKYSVVSPLILIAAIFCFTITSCNKLALVIKGSCFKFKTVSSASSISSV